MLSSADVKKLQVTYAIHRRAVEITHRKMQYLGASLLYSYVQNIMWSINGFSLQHPVQPEID